MISSPPSFMRSSPGEKTRIWSLRRSSTPPKNLPMPTGQVKGTTDMPSSRSISSISVERLLHLAVHLVDEGEDGRVAGAADLQQRRVCGSTPLAASITISAASTAVSTR